MSYKKVYKGQTFSQGMQFEDYCEFENCTFYAQTKFGIGCVFKNCTFLKCCPKYYTNPNSEVKQAIVEECFLEYVTIDAESLVVKPQMGARAIVQGKIDPGPQYIGQSADFCVCYCDPPTECGLGVDIAPKNGEPLEMKKVPTDCNQPCGEDRGFRT